MTDKNNDTFFRRFARDLESLNADILATEKNLHAARNGSNQKQMLEYTADLARLLTIARREWEAKALLEPALIHARALDDAHLIGWLLLEQATTNQYLRHDDTVLADFSEAIRIAQSVADLGLHHYALHHRGRYLVECGAYDLALQDFEQALAIRNTVEDESGVASTTQAIQDVLLLKQGLNNP